MFGLPLVFIVAMATASPSPAYATTAMPSFSTAQSRFSVRASSPFQIRMHVNSGTGYTWRPQGPLPPGFALLSVFQQPRGKVMPGGPGMQVLVFRASDVGTFRLNLEYVRAWERNAKAAKVQSFSVGVHR